MPRQFLVAFFLLISLKFFSQSDTSSTWVRAFPVTNYMVDLNDSVKVVQVHLYEGTSIAEKQIGLMKGIYRDKHSDTVTIGAGRCYLIKGEYYYFTVNYKHSGVIPREDDLIYTLVKKTDAYRGQLLRLASFFIGFQDVYEERIFDRYTIFQKWTRQDEEAAMDSMTRDIHFTGEYFLKNNPEMNVKIPDGKFKGKTVLDVMRTCQIEDLADFFDYMIARPNLYAGKQWKISEIFATWLSNSAPTVVKE